MKFTDSPLFVPGLGLAASLSLLFVPNGAAIGTGAMGATGSLGFISSTVLSRDERRKAERAIAQEKTRLATREQELNNRHKTAIEAAQRQLTQAIADRDKAIAETQAKLAEIASQRQQILADAKLVMGDDLRRQFEAEYAAKFDAATADMRRREDEFYHAEGELCDQIEALQTVLEQNETYLREEFGKENSARIEKFKARYSKLQGQVAEYGQVIQMASSEAMEELRQKDLAIANLKGKIELLSAPRKFRGSSQDDATSNKVIEFFIEKNVRLAVNDFDRRMDKLTVKFFPEGDTTTAHVMPLMEELQLRLGLYALPTVAVENNLITVTCQTDAKTPAKATINEPPLSRLEKAISDAIHVRIAAPSGSGKSVLLGNLVNYLTQTYLSTYELYDPKVTARQVWGNLTPTYYSTDCIPAFFSMAKTCLTRIDECKVAAQNNQPAPKFDPQFHIVDELEFMYGLVDILGNNDYTAKKFATNAKAGLKVGREHKIKLLFVTQSALCSDVNLKKNDFFNTTSLFLGQTIIEALDSDLMSAVSAEKKAVIRAEYKARLARGDKYTILVYEPEKPTEAWLCSAPSPGHYAALSTASTVSTGQNENPDLRGVATRTHFEGEQGATHTGQASPASDAEKTATQQRRSATDGDALIDAAAMLSDDLESLLNQGTHCPECSHHTSRYGKRKPNGKGNVSVKCTNPECSRKTFSWKVV